MIARFSLVGVVVALTASTLLVEANIEAAQPDVLKIGNRRELFVDHFLIDKLEGTRLKLHQPQADPGVLDKSIGAYATVIKDGDIYRRYYRSVVDGYAGSMHDGHPGEITCYAESRDGIHWVKPKLGLFEVNGTRENNVILANASPFSHNFSPFLDTRPGVDREERFKALACARSAERHLRISSTGARPSR